VHYLVGVILPFPYGGDKLDEALAEILKPWNEQDNENGHWDWWQLGGRWTGVWSDYEPEKDPDNFEECWLCGGTGLRTDRIGNQYRAEHPEYTCNGCDMEGRQGPQPGVMVKHATAWAKRPELDVISVSTLLNLVDLGTARIPYALAAAPDVWLERESWTDKGFVERKDWLALFRAELEKRRDCYIAAVDIHS
jgi:hypothetical protein